MTEIKDVDRLVMKIGPRPLVIAPGGKEILRLEADGTVVCADAVKANEAGRALVESLTREWAMAVSGIREAAEKAERDRICAWLIGEAEHYMAGCIEQGEHLK